MGWVISVEHRSGYRYRSPATDSYNEARMTTMTTPMQRTIRSSVEVQPWVRPYRYLDYWGTVVDAFDLHRPHGELVVRSASIVETGAGTAEWPTPTWGEIANPSVVDGLAEYLMPTVYVPRDIGMAEIAGALRDDRAPAEAVGAVGEWVSSHLSYTPGATHVSSSALEVFRVGHGVCQDYVHLSLALLRSMGIPSRYVSGYFHPEAEADVGRAVCGQSHAWCEVWLGHWYGFDPTNGLHAGERHVVVARARDYGDVPPMRGVYQGGEAEALDVDVEIIRLA